MNNPFDYTPSQKCRAAASRLRNLVESIPQWQSVIKEGKMFGVLLANDTDGKRVELYAYSGNMPYVPQIEKHFVPAIYNLLDPDGFFKRGEAEISQINREIEDIESNPQLISLINDRATIERDGVKIISELKERYNIDKVQRDALRREGQLSEEHIKQSQFQKAEIKRAQRSLKESLERIDKQILPYTNRTQQLKTLRKECSSKLQYEIFDHFKIVNALGEVRTLNEIFAETPQLIPPAGAGECSAPKLLQYAYKRGLKPIEMAEFWMGESPIGVVRRDGHFYPSCKGKCGPILEWMLKGVEILERVQYIEPENVEIIYEDHHLVAINKPYGMPSVPGKDSRCSAQDYISKLYPDAKMVHRLDRDTSGVLLAVKSSSDYTTIQQLFASNQVDKTYRAICTNNQAINLGDYGVVKLPICEDYEHRPAQRVDFNLGKESVTKYRVLTRDSQGTHIEFSPITGRTHQIRLHAAHPDGLNSPIVGDPIYGDASLAERMFLHAESIRFRSPFSNEIISICSPSPF